MSFFDRTVYVATLAFVVVALTGCFSGSNTGFILVSGTIVSSSTHVPVEDATVVLTRKQTSSESLTKGTQSTRVATTDRDGRFQFVGLARGIYDIKVSKQGHNPMVLTKKLDRASVITIELEVFLRLLHFSDSIRFNKYQIGAYVYPDGGQIQGAEIINPSGISRALSHEYKFGRERYGIWWNEPALEEGAWQMRIHQNAGEELIHWFSVHKSDMPSRPELISPIDGREVDLTYPIFEISMAGKIDAVQLWFYEVNDFDELTSQDGIDEESLMIVRVDGLSGTYTIPVGLLEPGKHYAWRACVIRSRDVPFSYSAVSDLHYFCVGR